ncbi:MAG: hypothetical protein V1774_07055 [Candidatus Eisenbacteria bacterium]
MNAHVPVWRAWASPVLLLLPLVLIPGVAAGDSVESRDAQYEQLIADYPQHQKEIEEFEAALADDPQAEEHLLAYNDSLTAHADLAQYEETMQEVVSGDSMLAETQAAFEAEAAADARSAAELAAFDSLLAANPELASSLEEIETSAAQDDALLEQHGEVMAQLEADPSLAEEFYADEDGPTYGGDDPEMIAYVNYLIFRPPLYRAWWRSYHYLRNHPLVAQGVYRHWRWFEPRRTLWCAWWDYRLRVARHRGAHESFWAQRLYLGHRPWLARPMWQHRLFISTRPVLRAQLHFYRHHPRVAGAVIDHRRWAMRHPAPPRAPVPPAKHAHKPPRHAPRP